MVERDRKMPNLPIETGLPVEVQREFQGIRPFDDPKHPDIQEKIADQLAKRQDPLASEEFVEDVISGKKSAIFKLGVAGAVSIVVGVIYEAKVRNWEDFKRIAEIVRAKREKK